MPKVPTYDLPGVAPSVGPAPYDQSRAPDTSFGSKQLGAAGAGLQEMGKVLTQEEINAEGMANQVRVDAALNKVRQQQLDLTYNPDKGYLNKKGAAALDPDPLGRSLPQRYGEELNETIQATAASLGNDAQRRVFTEQANSLATQFGGSVQSHMLQEFRAFGKETQLGTVKLAADAAKLNWNSPDMIAEQIKSAQAAVWKSGQLDGEPANLTSTKIKDTTSAIHAGVIASAIENNDPSYALSYINSKKSEMTADDLLRANSIVKADMRARVATSTAQSAMQSLQTRLAPTDVDRVLQITMQTESGGNRDAVGRFIPGQGTAKGEMQVMDKTNVDPGYGVVPAKDKSLEERARVGRDYMMAMVKEYGGDMAKAWAAYNAGPGRVDDALAKAKKEGGDWLARMPQETRDYVAKNTAALQKGAPAAMPSQQDVHEAIRAKLGAEADPKVLQAALAEGTRLYADFQNDRRVQGENATLAAQQWLIQNGGNLAALPPSLADAVTRNAPDKFDNLIDFSKKLAKGENTTNMAAYLDAVGNPDELVKMPQSVFNQFVMTQFSQSDGKHIATLRQSLIDDNGDSGAGGLNRPALNTALNNRLESIGINPKPKSLEEKSRVGSIQKFVTDAIFAEQKQLGRKMTSQEVSEFVDATMAKNVAFRSGFLGMYGAAAPEPMLGLKVSGIPEESVTAIRAALAARGNTKPTDDQILRTYWTSKNAK